MVTINKAIKRAVEVKGKSLLSDSQLLIFVLEDLVPELVREREIISQYHTPEIGEKLIFIHDDSTGQKDKMFLDLESTLVTQRSDLSQAYHEFLSFFKEAIGCTNTCQIQRESVFNNEIALYKSVENSISFTNHINPDTILHDRFCVLSVCDANCEGVTYVGYDNRTGKRVKIREFLPDSICSRAQNDKLVVIKHEYLSTFNVLMREFIELNKALARMNNLSHVIPQLEMFSENNTTYAVYQYLEGQSLLEYLKNTNTEQRLEFARKHLSSLLADIHSLHNAGILHRGLSPETIILTDKGEIKLTGFCISAARTKGSGLNAELFEGYAAPEQYSSDQIHGTWTDVYGICAVIYRILTGSRIPDAITRQDYDILIPPAKLNSNISENVSQCIMHGLELNYNTRIHTMKDLASLLYNNKPVYTPEANVNKDTLTDAADNVKVEPVVMVNDDDDSISSDDVDLDKLGRQARITRIAVFITALIALIPLLYLTFNMSNSFFNGHDNKSFNSHESSESFSDNQTESSFPSESSVETIHKKVVVPEHTNNLIAGFGDYFQYYISVNSNGTINALTGWDEHWYQTVTSWNDIIEVDLGPWHTVGLKKDGTVVVVANEPNPFPDDSYYERIGTEWKTWSDIVSVSAGDCFTVGLKKEGSVVVSGFDGKEGMQELVNEWSDIVAVSAGDGHIVGLRNNGSVVAVGNNDSGQCNVAEWNDIIAVSAGWDMTVGLKSDGSVVAVGNNDRGASNVAGWNDITAISARGFEIVGLKSDGTLVIASSNTNHNYEISEWKNLTAVYTGNSIIAGLKADGTILWAAGNDTNGVDYSNLRIEVDKNDDLTVTHLEIEPNVHYYGIDTIDGVTLDYDLYLVQNKTMISVTTPTENGGSISYFFDNISYSDGSYSYSNGIESEMVSGATRSLVVANDFFGTIRVIDDNTIEWTNTSNSVGTSFSVILKK